MRDSGSCDRSSNLREATISIWLTQFLGLWGRFNGCHSFLLLLYFQSPAVKTACGPWRTPYRPVLFPNIWSSLQSSCGQGSLQWSRCPLRPPTASCRRSCGECDSKNGNPSFLRSGTITALSNPHPSSSYGPKCSQVIIDEDFIRNLNVEILCLGLAHDLSPLLHILIDYVSWISNFFATLSRKVILGFLVTELLPMFLS